MLGYPRGFEGIDVGGDLVVVLFAPWKGDLLLNDLAILL